jgi:pimeloyl-ACP methyl ester carboxylesterase
MNNDPNPSAKTTRRRILQASIVAPLVSVAAAVDGPTSDSKPQRNDIFVKHDFPEQTADLGEVTMNYAVSGEPTNPALLLIPGQTESWWGYEKVMKLLDKDFQVYAVDLRGQGRTTWTPGRYTLDNMGNDLVRFLATVVKRPVVTSGCSSGGVLSAWLSAYAMPGQLRGAVYEDPPLFASELTPVYGPTIRQTVVGPLFYLFRIYHGDQWCVGDYSGMRKAAKNVRLPLPLSETPSQSLKEYDPEWARAFWEGTVAQSCRHDQMLSRVKVPVLFMHCRRQINPATETLMGAISDFQVQKVKELVTAAGQKFEYTSSPGVPHVMHAFEPKRFVELVSQWAKTLPV